MGDPRERAVGMPVFLGALRAKLILGVDDRVLMIVAAVALFGMFAPILFVAAGALFGIGRLVGAYSPYFFDEISVYFNWRLFSWAGTTPDDAFHRKPDPKFMSVFKRVKS